jgi:hypothetical protein
MRRLLGGAVTIVGIVVCGTWLGHALDPTRRLSLRRPTPFELPEFTATDEQGRIVRRQDLSGSVWVASFVFVECGGLERLWRLRQKGVPLVSFDIGGDSPDALARSFRRYRESGDRRWRVLSSDRALAAEIGLSDVLATRFLLLVDRDGMVQRRYDARNDSELRRLVEDWARLER